MFAPFADGTSIETVESLADGDNLDPIQTAFLENAAFQCGFCTPGFIMMTRELLDRIPDPSDEEIRHYLSGNLCRCAAYPEIITAVRVRRRANGERDASRPKLRSPCHTPTSAHFSTSCARTAN